MTRARDWLAAFLRVIGHMVHGHASITTAASATFSIFSGTEPPCFSTKKVVLYYSGIFNLLGAVKGPFVSMMN